MSSIALEIIKLACHCQIDLYNEIDVYQSQNRWQIEIDDSKIVWNKIENQLIENNFGIRFNQLIMIRLHLNRSSFFTARK